ncbi:MAG: two-component system response regulator [Magnetococcales bacterium]|nr:two-component system response regulator [Magnetococcales bacterium]
MNLDHKRPTLLVVDDTETNIDILVEGLEGAYDLAVATDGRTALASAHENPPDLILLDIMMPEMDGYEVCRRLKKDPNLREIPVIFITAMSQEENEAEGLAVGAVDYITKPISIPIVQARVATHLELFNSRRALKDQNELLEQRVRERTRELRESRLATITCLGRAAERKDPETGLHIQRMAHYSRILGTGMGLDPRVTELLLHAAPMHDIGKVGVPDRILLKPGPLNDEEWVTMRTHPDIGAEILSNQPSELLRIARDIALTHHEKWDGSGYPQGLKGDAIPLSGQIAALADVFDALTSARPYKLAWEVDRAVTTIVASKGIHFQDKIVESFVDVLPEMLTIMEQFREKPHK